MFTLGMHYVTSLAFFLYTLFVPAGPRTVCLTTGQTNCSRTNSVYQTGCPLSTVSKFFSSLTHTEPKEVLSSRCTHCKQVEQVCVGVDVRRRVLDECQLLKDGVQLLGFGEVDTCFLFINPVWKRHMHGYEVFQVHTKDGESKARALWEAFAVLAVVPTWCH